MNLKELKYKANYYILIILVFVIPLERRLGPPLIGLFLLSSLFNIRPKKNERKKILLFGILFIIYLISLLYTTDIIAGREDIVKKLSLLVFPIAFYLSDINFPKKLNNILTTFIEGCLASGAISLLISSLHYYFSLDTANFFYGNANTFLHSSYFAMYASFSILIIYHFIFTKKDQKSFTFLRVLLLVFLSILVVFSVSKTGLISLLLIHGGAILYWIIKEKAWLKGAILILSFMGITSIVFLSSNTIQDRVTELITVASTGETSSGSTTAARVEIWRISLDLITEKPFIGYGAGDVHHELTNQYRIQRFDDLYKKNLNAHNQFLQTNLATGLLGGITLILMLILPMYFSIKRHHYLYLFFLLLLTLNLLTESMFERQTGVVFYALFNVLFFSAYFGKNASEKIINRNFDF